MALPVGAGFAAIELWADEKGLTGKAKSDWVDKTVLRAVEQSQPTYDVRTSSQIARAARQGDTFSRVISLFTSVPNKHFNMGVQAITAYRAGDISGGAMLKQVTIPLIINSLFYYGYYKGFQYLWRKLAGAESEEDWGDNFMALAGRILGQWIFVGDILQFFGERVYRKARGKPTWGHGPRPGPLGTFMTEGGRVVDAGYDTAKAYAEGDEDAGRRLLKFFVEG